MFSMALPQHILYREPIKYGKTNEITRVDLVINYLVVNLLRIYLDSSFPSMDCVWLGKLGHVGLRLGQ